MIQYPFFKKIIQKQNKIPNKTPKLKNRDRVIYVRGIFNPPKEVINYSEKKLKLGFYWQFILPIFFLFSITCLMSLILIFGDYGIISTNDMNNRKNNIERSIKDLKTKEINMKEEIYALKYSPKYIEAFTRKELGIVRKNEKIYLLRDLE